jgi:hypothetical protein
MEVYNSDVPLTVLANVAKKVGIAVGPLAILDKINLKCMLVIMIKDSNLMCHDFNLLQTLVTITETHWRRGK